MLLLISRKPNEEAKAFRDCHQNKGDNQKGGNKTNEKFLQFDSSLLRGLKVSCSLQYNL